MKKSTKRAGLQVFFYLTSLTLFIDTLVEVRLLEERRHNCEVLSLEKGHDALARPVHVKVVGGSGREPLDLVSWWVRDNVIYKVKCCLWCHAVGVGVQDAWAADVLSVRELLLISPQRSLLVDWLEENV